MQSTSGSFRRRLTAWVRENPEKRQISGRELCTVYRSRRIPASAIADAVHEGLLKRSGKDQFEITIQLQNLCATELHTTTPHEQVSDTDTVPLPNTIQTRYAQPSKPDRNNLIFNQLPEKYKTPRRRNVVSRNYRSSKLSTDLSTVPSQFITESKYPESYTEPKCLKSNSQISEAPLESHFSSDPKYSEFAEAGDNYSESFNSSKSSKSLAEPCFEEYLYPSDKGYDEETFNRSLNNNNNNLKEKLTRARTRSNLRAKSTQSTKKSKLSELQAQAKRVIKSSPKDSPSKPQVRIETDLAVEADNGRIYAMAAIYEDQLQRYKNNPYLRAFRGNMLSERVRQRLLDAALLAEEVGVSYETYVKAQFWAFDRWYNSKPNIHNLCAKKGKVPSKKRVQLYLEAVRREEVVAEAYIHGPTRPTPKVSLSARFQNSENQLRRFMKNYNATEEEILCRFATRETANLYFDREWLRENETYQRLLREGRL